MSYWESFNSFVLIKFHLFQDVTHDDETNRGDTDESLVRGCHASCRPDARQSCDNSQQRRNKVTWCSVVSSCKGTSVK